jgi:alanine racemase
MRSELSHVASGRWAWVEIDLDAVAHNISELASRVHPAEMWAVVKADAYGHGAVSVAQTALGAGVHGLCVALVSEAEQLRAAGITAPILLLSQQPPELIPRIIAAGAIPTVDTPEYVRALVADLPQGARQAVHVKVDTGMQRVGVSPARVPELLKALGEAGDRVEISAVFTHLATADDLDDSGVRDQLVVFDQVRSTYRDQFGEARVHIANSAAAVAFPEARVDLVRVGIAMYGISPGPRIDALVGDESELDLRPVMRLVARVSHLKQVLAGSAISYGWHYRFSSDTTVATVPIGYADGVPRSLGLAGGAVVIAGTRCPILGVVTMDQLMVDVGHLGDDQVSVGDEVVLIGSQGDERVTATEWADLTGTIAYEVVCGISARVDRVNRRRVGN